MAVKYPRGTILFVSQVPDTNGVNPKDRYVVLVRDFEDGDAYLYGVAVTSSFTRPPPPTSVPLPWHRQGRCQTRLDKACVAECTWVVVTAEADVIRRGGTTPMALLLTILQEAQAYLPLPPSPPTPPPDPASSGS